MSRGLITGINGEGHYQVTRSIDNSRSLAEIAKLEAEIAALNIKLADLELLLIAAELAVAAAELELVSAIDAMKWAGSEGQAALDAATARLRDKQDALSELRAQKAALRLKRTASTKRLDFVRNHLVDDETTSAWCADYNLELAGEVGLIEIARGPTTGAGVTPPPIIRPGGTAGDQAAYDAATDGKLVPILSQGPAGAFFNYAMLPAMNKWKPRFRTGIITAKSGNTCTVDFSSYPVVTTPELINVNQAETVEAGIIYMNCNGVAFEIGDHVVVAFEGMNWANANVIGFVSNPRECAWPFILLVDNANAEGQSAWSYFLYKDSVAQVAMPAGVPALLPLAPIYNGRSQLAEAAHITFNYGWESALLSGNLYPHLGGINRYELAMFDGGGTIYARHADDLSPAVSGAILSSLIAPFQTRDMFAIPVQSTPTDNWNQIESTSVYNWAPVTGSVYETFQWIPAFGYAEPGNGLRVTGWYYGPIDEGFENLPTGGEAQLCCFMDCKGATGTVDLYRFGYCEAATRLDVTLMMVLVFFLFEDPPSIGGDTFYSWQSVTILAHADMRMGASLTPPEHAFSITDPFGDGLVPQVAMWSFAGWIDPDPDPLAPEQTRDTAGVAIVQGSRAKFYRYKGYLATVYSTDNYHSHSISINGTLLAVFEGINVIERVVVFDLFGVRADVASDAAYTMGGFTEVQVSAVVASVAAKTGVIIPVRPEGFTEQVITPVAGTLEPVTGIGDSSFASLLFNRRLTTGPTINKLQITDGIYGRVGTVVDECFQSTIVLEPPGLSSDKLVVTWGDDPVVQYTGYNMRGGFSGSLEADNVRFNGVGTGDSFTLPATFSIVSLEGGGYQPEGASGETYPGDCLTEDWQLDPDCDPGCDGIITLTATSSCGQTATREEESDISPVTISGDGDCNVGDIYSTGGGIAPYTFSFDSGTIDATTGEILSINNCSTPGLPRHGFVTVTDSCGNTAAKSVNLPNGTWLLQSVYCCREDCYIPYSHNTFYVYRDNLRYVIQDTNSCTNLTTQSGRDHYAALLALDCTDNSFLPIPANCQPPDKGYNVIVYRYDLYYWGCP